MGFLLTFSIIAQTFFCHENDYIIQSGLSKKGVENF
jgi:hypothetical protein